MIPHITPIVLHITVLHSSYCQYCRRQHHTLCHHCVAIAGTCFRNAITAAGSTVPVLVSRNAVSWMGSTALGTTIQALIGVLPSLAVYRLRRASISSG